MLVVTACAVLAFVVLLLYCILKIIQKCGKIGLYKISNKDKINITGITYIDDSTKIVCAEHGASKYVILIGRNTNLLLDKYGSQE